MNHSTITQSVTRGIRLSTIAALLVLLTSLLAIPQPARAGDPIEVWRTESAEILKGTLRWAITKANNNPDPDTITFHPDIDGQAIILAGVDEENGNLGGDLDILGKGGDLTIQGRGAGITIIDGGGTDRVFHICPNGGCTNTVTFIDVTIRNGKTGNGGGIYNEAGTTTLVGSTVRNNTAVSGGSGGGIFNNGTLIIQNSSTISYNTAGSGGGIYNNAGTTTLVGSTVRNNTAVSGGDGGGIFNYGTLNIQNGANISDNTAGHSGGGIYNEGTLNVQNGSTIGGFGVGNTADFGGGINNGGDGTTTVNGGTVSGNTANKKGGGIVNFAKLIVQNGSSIGEAGAPNTAEIGGGIYNWSGTTTVTGSTISGNTATVAGGGIHNLNNTTTVDSSTVSDNTANYGGGITNDATLLIRSGSTVSANKATFDGGGIINWAGTTTVDGSTISANTAAGGGGGILNLGTLYVQHNSNVSVNTAGSEGGGIHNNAGTTTVDGSAVSANTAQYGAGIYNRAALKVKNGSTIGGDGAGNQGIDNLPAGGGIYNDTGGTVTVDGSTVSANKGIHSGAGIYNKGTLTIKNGSVIGGAGAGNSANYSGGGIHNSGGTTTVNGSTVSANKATIDGGGIYNMGTLTVLNDSTIGGTGAGNMAQEGGGIYNGGTATVDGSTIRANTASHRGGGIFTKGSQMTVTGSRILDNSAANANGGGVYTNYDLTGVTSVTGSCIVGNSQWSLVNNKSASQTATGNWWGAAAGPNEPGADSVLGFWDVSDPKLTPILGCAPDLQVGKTNDTGGNGTVGTPFNWTLTISNSGVYSATFDTGQRILVDELPIGPTYGDPSARSFVDVTNSDNIVCSWAGSAIICTATGGPVTLEAKTGSFEVTISVTPSAPVTLVNPAGICKVDPDGNVTENDENNNCPQNIVNVLPNRLYLPVVMK